MRVIVACDTCNRQFDATGRKAGTQLRCLCGEVLTVTSPAGHEAAVVRCSSCGGARQPGQPSCAYCQASFTIHERDLHTICPSCMARISDKARFCHHCAQPIHPESTDLGASDVPCPVCGDGHPLTHRSLGEAALPLLECPTCAGIWMSAASFKGLEKVAAEEGRSSQVAVTTGPASGPGPLGQAGPMYRKCPVCAVVMNRQNYGRISGVIIDVCKEHGVWFDAHELGDLTADLAASGWQVPPDVRRFLSEMFPQKGEESC